MWIIREITEGTESEFDSSLFEKCARAINERNLLIHRRQRNISRDKALDYVLAIAELIEKVRKFRRT